MDLNENLLNLVDQFKNFKAHEWDNLPDIELYMDQVIVYLNKLLKPQLRFEDSSLLTPSMINNYVKSGHILPPEKKKYKKEQLAALYMICSVKQNLLINDAASLLETLNSVRNFESLYSDFIDLQQSAFSELSTKIDDFMKSQTEDELSDATLAKLALMLTLQATCNRLAAERIISMLSKNDPPDQKQQHKKD